MLRISTGGHDYVIGKLDAMSQLHVSRRIAPIIPVLVPMIQEMAKGDIQELATKLKQATDDESQALAVADADLSGLASAFQPFADALAEMSEENTDYVVKTCLSVVKRDNGGTLAPVCLNSHLMFSDLELGQILPLVIAVLRVSLGNFIQGLLTKAMATEQPT